MASPAVAGAGVRGDANCSGRSDAIDSSLVLQFDAGLVHTLPCQQLADVDLNGTVNSIDASLILQRVANVIASFPAFVSLNLETAGPVNVGDEIVVEVRVDEASHLAAFDFTLTFDESVVDVIRFDNLGSFLATGSRGTPVCFPGPMDEIEDFPHYATCSTVGLPTCMGGGAGATGDGTLARAVFRAKRAGTTVIHLSRSTLVWDNVFVCEPSMLDPVRLPHVRGSDVSISVR